MKTKYRIKVEYFYNGEYWYTPQRRIMFIWFSYKVITGWDGSTSVIHFSTKEEAMEVIDRWRTEKVYPKVKYINL